MKNNSKYKKVIFGILCFIAFFIAYYFVVSFIAAIPLYFIDKSLGDGADSGLWAYALIAGAILSPILSSITTFKIMNKDKY